MLSAASPPTPPPLPPNWRPDNPELQDGVDESTRRRILLADDNADTLVTYGMLLRDAGYSVATAASARQCIAMIRHECFDLILLDMRFGNVDGLKLLRRLRRIGVDVPIAIMTAFGDIDSAVAAMKYGAEDFVAKALDEDALLEVVRRNLRDDVNDRLTPFACPVPLLTSSMGLIAHLRSDVAGSMRHLRHPGATIEEIRTERLRIGTLLASVCARHDLNVGEFAACAEALRRLMSTVDGPIRHALIEVRDALARDIWRARAPSLPRIRQVVDGLARGDTVLLRRSEADWGLDLGLHRTGVGRLLYTETGRRFREWCRVCRLKRATFLLAQDDEHVAQIAFMVGFEHTQTSQFTREFHGMFGLTPGAFRTLSRR